MTDHDYRAELHRVIRLVRNRYRLRVLLTGVLVLLAGAVLLLLVSAALLERFNFGVPRSWSLDPGSTWCWARSCSASW
jgi:hypothetical protein